LGGSSVLDSAHKMRPIGASSSGWRMSLVGRSRCLPSFGQRAGPVGCLGGSVLSKRKGQALKNFRFWRWSQFATTSVLSSAVS
jgi:hypothetical protein